MRPSARASFFLTIGQEPARRLSSAPRHRALLLPRPDFAIPSSPAADRWRALHFGEVGLTYVHHDDVGDAARGVLGQRVEGAVGFVEHGDIVGSEEEKAPVGQIVAN